MLLRLSILENTTNSALISLILDTDPDEQPQWTNDDTIKSLLDQSTDIPLDAILTPTPQHPSYVQIPRIGTTSMFHYSPALKGLIIQGNTLDFQITSVHPSTDHSSLIFQLQDPE